MGRVGDRGSVPTLKDSQVLLGFLRRVSAGDGGIVSNPGTKIGFIAPGGGGGYTPGQGFGGRVELFAFDKDYVDRLRGGDPATGQHFAAYFGQLLRIKLRARMIASETVDDLRQETYIRVVAALRREGGVRQPERFGAFVNSICNNVLQEHYRASSRSQPLEDSHLERPDQNVDLEGQLVTKQCRERVRQVLEEMPARDRDLLRAIFLQEKEKDEVCAQFGVDREYLRVLLHRAKDKFRVLYEKDRVGLAARAIARREA